jgi:serine/threonine-protein kinase
MLRLVPARLLAALRPDSATSVDGALDLAPEFRGRVRIAAALGACGYAIFLAVELTRPTSLGSLERSINRIHDLTGLGLCAALWIAANLEAIEDRVLLRAALVMEALLIAVISTAVPWAGYLRTTHVSSLTWAVPIIILFALLVPVRPAITAWVSALCALLIPAAIVALDMLGMIRVGVSDVLQSAATGTVAAGIATVASRTVYGARRQAAAARLAGSYELVERLGQGGMGEVWKARHLLLARPAAVKLILPEVLRGPTEERDSVTQRFTREAQVTASLRSPHTVELFDFGIAADHTLYYAMELLEGVNLEHFVYRFGPIEPRRAVHWLRQACHSLGEAHSRGLVHRDIKPGNIFLCRDGRDVDVIKILDFGLTKVAATPGAAVSTVTHDRIGTPAYMAPEQVFGLEADPRTDLYALGCVGYWLLAGRKPFEAETAGDMLRQHAQANPPDLSSTAPQRVPARLQVLIMRCLSKDPDQRPADADHLALELGDVLDEAPWSEADALAWWKTNLPEL